MGVFRGFSEGGELGEHNKLGGLCIVLCNALMSSVKRQRPNGPFYLCYKIPTGRLKPDGKPEFRRVQESSGIYDEKQADDLASQYERVAKAASEKRFTETSARKFLDTIAVLTDITIAHTETPQQHFSRWINSRRLVVAKKTLLNYETVVRDFLAFLATRNVLSLADVTHSVATDFRDQEIGLGKSAATINKALSILGQALEPAVVNQVLPMNPVRGLRIKGRRSKPQSRRAFTFEEFSRLIAAVHPESKSVRGRVLDADWQTFLLLLGYTGGRQQEVAKLRWEHINFKENRIGIVRSKNDDVHVIPIHPALYRHLEILKKKTKAKDGPVMPHIGKEKGRTLSKHFREFVLPRIGIRQPYVRRQTSTDQEDKRPAQVGRKLAEYSLHSLRHSLSSWLNAQGVPEMTRMRLVGHEDTDISRDYTHESHVQMSEALKKIPDFSSILTKQPAAKGKP